MKQTLFFSFNRAARASCLLFALGFSIITGCAKAPTAVTPAPQVASQTPSDTVYPTAPIHPAVPIPPAVREDTTSPVQPTPLEHPVAWKPAGKYQEIDSNWIGGFCSTMTRFCLTFDSSGKATQLVVTNGIVSVPVTSRLASPKRFDGPALISSSTKSYDSAIVIFTMSQYDRPHTLTVAVTGDTLRGRMQAYREDKGVAVVAVKVKD